MDLEIPRPNEFRGYIPSPEHRSLVSSDPLSQTRLEFVKSIGDSLGIFPFYQSLTLKGSLSKGKILTPANASQTDINLGCILDYDAIAQLSKLQFLKLCLRYKIPYHLDRKPVTVNEGKYNIFPSDRVSTTELGRIRLIRSIVDKYIQEQAKTFFGIHKEAKPSDIWPEIAVYSSEPDEPFSLYTTLQQYEAVREKTEEERIAVIRALALPFGMVVAGNLTSYLGAFFGKLTSQSPEIAEEKWQVVRKAIIGNERPGLVPPIIKTQYPNTINEAIQLYVTLR